MRVTLKKDDVIWAGTGKTITLYDGDNLVATLTDSSGSGVYTGYAPVGNYSIYDGSTATDRVVTVANTTASSPNTQTVDYYTLTVNASYALIGSPTGTLSAGTASVSEATEGTPGSASVVLLAGSTPSVSAAAGTYSRIKVSTFSDSADATRIVTIAGTKAYAYTMDGHGITAPRTISVTFERSPAVPEVTNPDRAETTVGGSASFSVALHAGYTPIGTISYQWQQWNETSQAWEDIAGSTASTLSFSDVTKALNGTQYRCAVTDDYYDQTAYSNGASLAVNDVPTVSISGTTTVVTGSDTTLTAVPEDGTPDYTYNWYDQGGTLVGTGVTFNTPALTEDTTYTVIMTDAAGITATDTVTVTVNGILSVSVSPQTSAITYGDSQTLTATVSGGIGPFTYIWTDKAGNTVGTESAITVSPGSTETYTCTVTDPGNDEVPKTSATALAVVTVTYVGTVNVTLDDAAWAGCTQSLSLSRGSDTKDLVSGGDGSFSVSGLNAGTWAVLADGADIGKVVTVGANGCTPALLEYYSLTLSINSVNGGSGTLVVAGTGYSQSATLTLLKGSAPVVRADPASGSSLKSFTDAVSADKGYAEVLAGYTAASMEAPNTLTVSFVLDPVPLTVKGGGAYTIDEGESVAMSVDVTSSPIGTVTYQWQISRDGGLTWTDVAGATNKTYRTPTLTTDDTGVVFHCVVTDDYGPVTKISDIFTITVREVVLPGTGDHFPLGLYAVMLLFGVAGLTLLAVSRRKA